MGESDSEGGPNDALKVFTKKQYAEPWNMTGLAGETVRIGIMLNLIGTGKQVLDVGCYDGQISALIKDRGNAVYGVDISESAVEMAMQRGIIAKVGDLDRGLPFPSDSFDVVLASEVVEHVLDVDLLMEEANRVLRRTGSAVLTTPNLASFGRRLLLLMGKNPLVETRWTEGSAGHVRYFVKDTLLDLLKHHNFTMERFCSDVVNFDNSGRRLSTRFAKWFPTFGRSLIVKAAKSQR
jgi:methionine biosynthesis protein MetW